ncbi:MAG: hypothetical protein O3B09_04720, partial [Proteobacteria bacterium]|nr:hypothetical protein [Pseudomonadota bacterium]
MRRDFRKNKLFNRRTLILGGIKSSLTAILITRLGYLQLFKNEEYTTRSDQNRIKALINPAPRGVIVDRNDVALTQNNQNYRLLLYLENKSDTIQTVQNLKEILNFDDKTQDRMLKKIKNARKKSIISLMDNLLWDDLARIEANAHKLPSIDIEEGL